MKKTTTILLTLLYILFMCAIIIITTNNNSSSNERTIKSLLISRNSVKNIKKRSLLDENEFPTRKVGRLGKNGTFGFFKNRQFFKCPPPQQLIPDPEISGHYIIPPDLLYYKDCQYYDSDPTVENKLYDSNHNNNFGNANSTEKKYFGYFESGKFHNCETAKSILNNIDNQFSATYPSLCKYYSDEEYAQLNSSHSIHEFLKFDLILKIIYLRSLCAIFS